MASAKGPGSGSGAREVVMTLGGVSIKAEAQSKDVVGWPWVTLEAFKWSVPEARSGIACGNLEGQQMSL